MSKKIELNNFKFGTVLDEFEAHLIKPMEEELKKANEIILDPNYPWKEGQKDKALARRDSMSKIAIMYSEYHRHGGILASQHETLVNKLSEIYACWYNNISNKGKQPTEMMDSQADMLQNIFKDIYDILEPLKLPIEKPAP